MLPVLSMPREPASSVPRLDTGIFSWPGGLFLTPTPARVPTPFVQFAATISRDNIDAALRQLMPLEIRFHDPGEPERTLVVDPPSELLLVPGKGVEIRTSAKLTWQVLGI